MAKDKDENFLIYDEYIVERMKEINKKVAWYSMNQDDHIDIDLLLYEIDVKSLEIKRENKTKKLVKERKK